MSKLHFFIGAETGGLEEVQSAGTGWSASNATAKSGSYSYKATKGATETILLPVAGRSAVPSSQIDVRHIFGFNFRYTGTPNNSQSSRIFGDHSSSMVFAVFVKTDASGNMVLNLTGGGFTNTDGTTQLSADTDYYIEVYWNPQNTGGVVKLYLDGNLEISVTGDTFNTTVLTPTFWSFLTSAVNVDYYIDDIYELDFCTDENDRLGPVEVHAFQNTAGATTTPDFVFSGNGVLDAGTWANIANTPVNASVASYTGDPKGGLADLEGPSSWPLTGGSILGIEHLIRASRGNGGGTTHSLLTGTAADTAIGQVNIFDLALDTSVANFRFKQSVLSAPVSATTGVLNRTALDAIAYLPSADLVIVADSDSTAVGYHYSSNGGNSFSAATTPTFAGSENTYFAVRETSELIVSVTGTKIAYSTNGTSWTEATSSPQSGIGYGLSYDAVNGKFIYSGVGATELYYSSDGDTFTQRTSAPAGLNGPSAYLTSGAGVTVAWNVTGAMMIRSTDGGVNWSECSSYAQTSVLYIFYCEELGMFFTSGSDEFFYSYDGDTWTANTTHPYYGDGAIRYVNAFLIPGTTDQFAFFTNSLHGYAWTSDGINFETQYKYGSSPVIAEPKAYDSSRGKIVTTGASDGSNVKPTIIGSLTDPTAYDLAHGFSVAGARDISVVEIWTMVLFVPAGVQTLEAAVTFGLDLDLAQSANATAYDDVSLAIDLDQSQFAVMTAEEALSLAHDLDQSQAASLAVDADTSFDHSLSQAQVSDASMEAALSLPHDLDQSQTSDASMEAAIALSHDLIQSQSTDAVMAAALALAHDLSQSQAGASVVDASMSLGHDLSQAQDADVSIEAAVSMALQLSQDHSAQASMAAALSVTYNLSIEETAQAVKEAALSLGIDLAQAQIGALDAQTVEAALTLAIKLSGPEGTLSNELNPDSGFDQPTYWN